MVLQQGATAQVAPPLTASSGGRRVPGRRRGAGGPGSGTGCEPGIYSVASKSTPGHSSCVHAAASSRRHVLGEEHDDVHQEQFVELPTGQPAAGSGVVTPPSNPPRTGGCPGRPLRARVTRGPPTRRIGREVRHRLAKPWSGSSPRAFDPRILRKNAPADGRCRRVTAGTTADGRCRLPGRSASVSARPAARTSPLPRSSWLRGAGPAPAFGRSWDRTEDGPSPAGVPGPPRCRPPRSRTSPRPRRP